MFLAEKRFLAERILKAWQRVERDVGDVISLSEEDVGVSRESMADVVSSIKKCLSEAQAAVRANTIDEKFSGA